MKTIIANKIVTNVGRLSREIQEDSILGPLYVSMAGGNGKFIFNFNDAFDSADESYLLTDFLLNFDDVDDSELKTPKIYDYVEGDARRKHFHVIDYHKDVNVYWYREDTWGIGNEKGLLRMVEYFSDEEKTNKVLEVQIDYIQDPFGNLVSKNTVRKWYNRDGSINSEIKQKPSPKIYTPTQSRQATARRRENVVAQLEAQLIGMLQDPEATVEEQAASLTLGVQFLTAVSPELNEFLNSGNITGIAIFVQDPSNQVTFPFLLAQVAPGYFVWQFIIDGVTY